MSPSVVSQHLKIGQQVFHLRRPHAVVRANRVRQDQGGTVCLALKTIEQADIVNGCERQGGYSFSSSAVASAESKRLRNASALPRYSSGASSFFKVSRSRWRLTSGISPSAS